jgi:hypothetical protein
MKKALVVVTVLPLAVLTHAQAGVWTLCGQRCRPDQPRPGLGAGTDL